MNQRSTLLFAALLGALSVSIGAFGAHGLKNILMETGRTETFELAVRYQFYHTFAIFFTGMLMFHLRNRLLNFAALFFVLGIIFFSGSLYILSLTGKTWLGAVTPLGGLLFIIGWMLLFYSIWKELKS
jgi:uncharacterized membrane protein YgdD (TMEM256/DUF423 family)